MESIKNKIIFYFVLCLFLFCNGCGGGGSSNKLMIGWTENQTQPSATNTPSLTQNQQNIGDFPSTTRVDVGIISGFAKLPGQSDNSGIVIKMERMSDSSGYYSDYSYKIRERILTAVDSAESPEYSTVTNKQGFFLIPNVVVGRYTIIAEKGSDLKAIYQNIRLYKESTVAETAKEIELKRTGTIKGIVKDKDGKPITDVFVYLSDSPYFVFTSSDGSFNFKNIPVSRYNIYTKKNGYSSYDSSTVTVESDKESSVELKLGNANSYYEKAEIGELMQRAEGYTNASQFDLAIAEYKKIIDNYTDKETNYRSTAQYKIGYIYYLKNDCTNAVLEYKKVIDNFSSSSYKDDSHLSIAECYYKSNDKTSGNSELTKYINSVSDTNKPSAVYQKVIDNYPKSSEVVTALEQTARIYLTYIKNYNSAIAAYQKIVDSYPADYNARYALQEIGDIYYENLNDYTEALTAYQLFRSRYPSYYNDSYIKQRIDELTADKDKDGKNYAEEHDAGTSDSPADNNPMPGKEPLPENTKEEDAFGGIMHTSTPVISDVKFSPEVPKAGEAVTVSAKVELGVSDDEDAKLKSVKIGYSTDGKTWSSVDMKCDNKGACSGQIPGQDTDREITFYISAEDSYNNISTEMPYKSSWPATKENLVQGAGDMDNSADIVPNDLDIISTMIGYDDDYLYVSYSVQGKITGGTIDPPYIHIYGAKITNPDTDEGEGLMVGKLFVYGPIAPTLAEKFKAQIELAQGSNFQIPECGVIDIQKVMASPVEAQLKTAEPVCDVKENTFTGRIKRTALGENPSGILRLIFITAANASVESFMPIPLNATHYTQISMRNHKYKVGL